MAPWSDGYSTPRGDRRVLSRAPAFARALEAAHRAHARSCNPGGNASQCLPLHPGTRLGQAQGNARAGATERRAIVADRNRRRSRSGASRAGHNRNAPRSRNRGAASRSCGAERRDQRLSFALRPRSAAPPACRSASAERQAGSGGPLEVVSTNWRVVRETGTALPTAQPPRWLRSAWLSLTGYRTFLSAPIIGGTADEFVVRAVSRLTAPPSRRKRPTIWPSYMPIPWCLVDRRCMLIGGVTFGSVCPPVSQMLIALEREGRPKPGATRSIGLPINTVTPPELRLSLGQPS